MNPALHSQFCKLLLPAGPRLYRGHMVHCVCFKRVALLSSRYSLAGHGSQIPVFKTSLFPASQDMHTPGSLVLCKHRARSVPRGHCAHHKHGDSRTTSDEFNARKRAFIYCPSLHVEHSVAPTPENLPASHAIHFAAPDCDFVFETQFLQRLPAGYAYFPATQSRHVVSLAKELLPTAQNSQLGLMHL